jgi:hypothetical protein
MNVKVAFAIILAALALVSCKSSDCGCGYGQLDVQDSRAEQMA